MAGEKLSHRYTQGTSIGFVLVALVFDFRALVLARQKFSLSLHVFY
jgi:hypothetical protein